MCAFRCHLGTKNVKKPPAALFTSFYTNLGQLLKKILQEGGPPLIWCFRAPDPMGRHWVHSHSHSHLHSSPQFRCISELYLHSSDAFLNFISTVQTHFWTLCFLTDAFLFSQKKSASRTQQTSPSMHMWPMHRYAHNAPPWKSEQKQQKKCKYNTADISFYAFVISALCAFLYLF